MSCELKAAFRSPFSFLSRRVVSVSADTEMPVQKMAREDTRVGRWRDAQENSWPDYGVRVPTVRNPRPEGFIRLIYFDKRRSAELLEHIAAASPGRDMLVELARFAKLPEFGSTGTLCQQDQRAILSQLIDKATDLDTEGVIDLHQPSEDPRRTSWTKLHPDQAIAIRGEVTSAKDIQPSSLRVEVGSTTVRVYVERDHLLHLNQSYLAGLPITVVGKVRSVPRTEMCAAAIGNLSA
jgi:hypothetical protein